MSAENEKCQKINLHGSSFQEKMATSLKILPCGWDLKGVYIRIHNSMQLAYEILTRDDLCYNTCPVYSKRISPNCQRIAEYYCIM